MVLLAQTLLSTRAVLNYFAITWLSGFAALWPVFAFHSYFILVDGKMEERAPSTCGKGQRHGWFGFTMIDPVLEPFPLSKACVDTSEFEASLGI